MEAGGNIPEGVASVLREISRAASRSSRLRSLESVAKDGPLFPRETSPTTDPRGAQEIVTFGFRCIRPRAGGGATLSLSEIGRSVEMTAPRSATSPARRHLRR